MAGVAPRWSFGDDLDDLAGKDRAFLVQAVEDKKAFEAIALDRHASGNAARRITGPHVVEAQPPRCDRRRLALAQPAEAVGRALEAQGLRARLDEEEVERLDALDAALGTSVEGVERVLALPRDPRQARRLRRRLRQLADDPTVGPALGGGAEYLGRE